jgi:hypothetical protein
MTDLWKIDRPPPQLRSGITRTQNRELMAKRLKVIAAIFETTASQLLDEQIDDDMMKQLYAASELLNSEIEALELSLVEH